MREYWVQVHKSPIVYRYVDWSITVPLQMIEFNLILKAAGKPVSGGMFWRLLIGTVMMLGFGFAGETGGINAYAGFIFGMAGWAYILYEIFLWFCRRDWRHQRVRWLHLRHGWLGLHFVRDLPLVLQERLAASTRTLASSSAWLA